MKKLAAALLVLVLVFTCLPTVVYACAALYNAGQGCWVTTRTPTDLQGCEDNLDNCEFEDYNGLKFYIVTRSWSYGSACNAE